MVKKLLDGFLVPNAALYYFMPVSIIAILIGYAHLLSDPIKYINLTFFAIVISLLSISIVFSFQLLLRNLFSNALTLSIAVTVLIILVGFFRGALMNNFIYIVIPEEIDTGNRLFSSAITTVVWLGLLSLSINSRNEFKQKFEALISQAILNRFTMISDKELAHELSKIESELKSIEMPLSNALLTSEGFKRIAEQVDIKVQNSIRPLSHKLWNQSSGKIPKINFFI